MTTEACAYIRVSGLGQREGDGPERQRLAIQRYADSKSLTIAPEHWFEEPGISGTKELEDRPALWALYQCAGDGGPKIVVVEEAGRLARDTLTGLLILVQMEDRGVRVYASDGRELTNVTDPTAKLFRGMLLLVAEWDRGQIVARLAAARKRIRDDPDGTGRCEGAKPYGSRPGESEIIARAKELRAGGMGLKEIAAALNGEDLRPRRACRW